MRGTEQPTAFDVVTLPYPGFPTDLQPFALVYDAVAKGSAMVTENLFEARFHTATEVARLGADVRVDGHHALVRGRERLSAAPVVGSDIRAAAALVLAGLVADGVTTVEGSGTSTAATRTSTRTSAAWAPTSSASRCPSLVEGLL
ncbi:hypothetical protein GCM10025868_38800 [Angustibacter aerolatus]|uniref:UDP-N-acetylglucosamine 1-carboxyvinyltransferase n=1 Tax=Angustibacter aerolatus TaxID=1162965 RepID=A0ABQ6JPG8_9ACTN|nr:hypothetical protein [Angustibacter aerolatus]GMA88630.1 hypothetical protein GCM10025868_38800 [Angustibacter aerolatus]